MYAYAYFMTRCSPRRTQLDGVTHLLLVCTVCGQDLRIIETDNSLVLALKRHGVRVLVQLLDGVRYLYVNAPKDCLECVSVPCCHRHMSGGVIQVSTKEEMCDELAKSIALLS